MQITNKCPFHPLVYLLICQSCIKKNAKCKKKKAKNAAFGQNLKCEEIQKNASFIFSLPLIQPHLPNDTSPLLFNFRFVHQMIDSWIPLLKNRAYVLAF